MTYGISHPAFRRMNRLYSHFCSTCGEDTPHQRGSCLRCKTVNLSNTEYRGKVIKKIRRIAAAARKKTGSSEAARVAVARRSAYFSIQIAKDKADYLRRQAEASRQKFEGRK